MRKLEIVFKNHKHEAKLAVAVIKTSFKFLKEILIKKITGKKSSNI